MEILRRRRNNSSLLPVSIPARSYNYPPTILNGLSNPHRTLILKLLPIKNKDRGPTVMQMRNWAWDNRTLSLYVPLYSSSRQNLKQCVAKVGLHWSPELTNFTQSVELWLAFCKFINTTNRLPLSKWIQWRPTQHRSRPQFCQLIPCE